MSRNMAETFPFNIVLRLPFFRLMNFSQLRQFLRMAARSCFHQCDEGATSAAVARSDSESLNSTKVLNG